MTLNYEIRSTYAQLYYAIIYDDTGTDVDRTKEYATEDEAHDRAVDMMRQRDLEWLATWPV
jgi:hypothetical protein